MLVLVPGCLFRPGMDWCGSFLLSFFLFCLELEDKDSVLWCLGEGLPFLTLSDLEADLFLLLLFLGLGDGVFFLAEGLGDGVFDGDLVVLGLFLRDVDAGTTVMLYSESLSETL